MAISSSPMSTPLFQALLRLYHLFPLHAPATLFLLDAPMGRFAFSEQVGREGKLAWGDLNGNWAWAFMEIVSPVTFIAVIASNVAPTALSTGTQIAAAMFLIHYAIRAIISPLVLAPKRSPQNISVTASSVFFNLLNGYCMGSFIAGDPIRSGTERSWGFWALAFGWAVGLAGNIYHDEILHDLRRPSLLFRYLPFVQSRHDASPTGNDNSSVSEVKSESNGNTSTKPAGGKYLIPRGGLFHWVTFPNYLCEWFEWALYAIIISPDPFLRSNAMITHSSSSLSYNYSSLTQRFIGIMAALPFPPFLLSPPWMFLLALLAAMIPRAIRGERWYKKRFGAEWEKSGRRGGRWVCLPGLL